MATMERRRNSTSLQTSAPPQGSELRFEAPENKFSVSPTAVVDREEIPVEEVIGMQDYDSCDDDDLDEPISPETFKELIRIILIGATVLLFRYLMMK